jgi:hypothetical protein
MRGASMRCILTAGIYSILVENPEGKDYLQDLGVEGRMTLNCIFEK